MKNYYQWVGSKIRLIRKQAVCDAGRISRKNYKSALIFPAIFFVQVAIAN